MQGQRCLDRDEAVDLDKADEADVPEMEVEAEAEEPAKVCSLPLFAFKFSCIFLFQLWCFSGMHCCVPSEKTLL